MMDELCYEFFREFARHEFCLKKVGLLKMEGYVKADWITYANEVQEVFELPQTPELEAAIEYFIEHPPKKQTINANGELCWIDSIPRKNTPEKIIILIQRVRNNLFHGSKFNGGWFDQDRSEQLMKHALVILAACRERHEAVRGAYQEDE